MPADLLVMYLFCNVPSPGLPGVPPCKGGQAKVIARVCKEISIRLSIQKLQTAYYLMCIVGIL